MRAAEAISGRAQNPGLDLWLDDDIAETRPQGGQALGRHVRIRFSVCYRSPDTERNMSDELPTASANREFTAKIVAAYVRGNQIGADQVASLISTVQEALAGLDRPVEPAARIPAVPIRRSIHHDYVVCLDCGWRGQTLRRHIARAHGLTVEQYRGRWSLRRGHPLTAPGYSERRSTMARQLGLGRGGVSAASAAAPEAEPETAPSPRARGRPRKARS